MPAEDAGLFAGDITVYYGIMPAQNANIGMTAILSAAKVTQGAAALVDENFAAVLDAGLWKLQAESVASVAVVTDADPFWVYWTSPASGFTLQKNPGLEAANWVDSTAKASLVGTQWRVLVTGDELPGPDAGYFRLVKPYSSEGLRKNSKGAGYPAPFFLAPMGSYLEVMGRILMFRKET